MSDMLREIEVAYMLGYQEMRDFRAALKAKIVPKPCRELGAGKRKVRVWSRRKLLEWIDNAESDEVNRSSLLDDIEARA